MTGPMETDAAGPAGFTHHQKGLELLRAKQPALAVAELERAAQLSPGNHEFLKSLGNALKAAGNPERAVACYRRSLELMPDHLPSLYNLGLTLHEMNRLQEAERALRRVQKIDARDTDALTHLGMVLCKQARFPEAVAMFRAALALAPGNPYLWLCLGSACHEIPEQRDESIRCLRKCIDIEPALAEPYCQLGVAYRKLGKPAEASVAYAKALELEPRAADALDGMGNILQDEGRLDEAVERHRAAIGISPRNASLHNNLGCALVRMNRLNEAVDSFRQAVSLQPDFASAHMNLGNAYGLLGACDLAIRSHQAALGLRPGDAAIRGCLLFEMQNICDWSRLDELCELQRRGIDDSSQTILPFSLLSIPTTAQEQLQCAMIFGKRQSALVAADRERLAFRFDRTRDARLRIGYLSADFHEHATAHLTAELFELHDRRRFEITAYSYGPDDSSPMRARLKRAFDRFVDIGPLSHAAAAAVIHADRTDILVDLKGYTQHARTEIVALRPAPVQVSFIGYPGAMGAGFIDYIVGDRFVTPRERAVDYREKLVLIPGSYQPNDRKRPVAPAASRSELGLREQSFVFCCFNQTYKILPGTFTIWMRLLDAVPSSVLWLLESNRWAAQNLRREARNRGVDPARLVFAPKLPLARHLGRMQAADLFLDTLPCNAHTTASDALWAGLPVLTLPGDTFASRVAGSLLNAVGLPEMIVGSVEEYEALALKLAREPQRLAALREKLARNKAAAPLFDTPAFVRHLEAAYARMWTSYVAGAEPSEIEL